MIYKKIINLFKKQQQVKNSAFFSGRPEIRNKRSVSICYRANTKEVRSA